MAAKEKSIEELREELARQILELALEDSNPQYKLDAFKATQRAPDRAKQPGGEAAPDAMAVFQARVRKAADLRDSDGASE